MASLTSMGFVSFVSPVGAKEYSRIVSLITSMTGGTEGTINWVILSLQIVRKGFYFLEV